MGVNQDLADGPLEQRLCATDETFIDVRKDTDGVVINTKTLNSFQLTNGWIYVGHATGISLYYKFTKGLLSSLSIIPEFSMDKVISFGFSLWDNTASSSTIVIRKGTSFFTGSDGDEGVLLINNPCMRWLRFYTSSTGTITDSSLILKIARGLNSGNLEAV